MSGTSMAAPTVTGSIALLVEHYQDYYGTSAKLWASTLKGLIIHTADDMDSDGNAATHPDGPDYRVGYGLVNARRAAEVITADGLNGNHPFIKQVLAYVSYSTPREYFEMPVIAAGGPMRITILYSDVPGPPDPNDPEDTECYGEPQMGCDAWLVHPGAGNVETLPWTLNWAFPEEAASQNYLSTQSVQVFDLPAATAGETYMLRLGPYAGNPNVPATSWGPDALPISIIISGGQAPPEAEFKITNIERVGAAPHVFSIEWPTIPGHFYRVETSTDLITWSRAKKPVGAGVEIGDISPPGILTTAEILAEPSNTRQFWRVRKLQPWDVGP